jgi:hypothetical protein
LDTLVRLREQYYIKENKRVYNEDQKRKEMDKKQVKDPLAEAEQKAEEEKRKLEDEKNEHIYRFSKHGIFTLPEYDFPHFVCVFDKPSENSLVTDYLKISDELGLENLGNLGITIIINERYMFVTTLSKPYSQLENGLDLFVDGFSYGGIMNIHTKQQGWPQTAGIDVQDNIVSYLPCRAYSEPTPDQLPEEETPLEAEGEQEAEGDQAKEAEGESDNEKEDDD